MAKDPATIERIQYRSGEITLIGTAHISELSAEQVESEIRARCPQAVCVELDEQRYGAMQGKSQWDNLHINKIIRKRQGMLLLASFVLSIYQRRLAKKLGVESGVEIIRAISVARELGVPVSLVDRRLQVTLRRAWRYSGLWSKMKLVGVLMGSLFQMNEASSEEIEELKNSNLMEQMFSELAEFLPQVKRILIDERDEYLATMMYAQAVKTPDVVGIIGAGHLRGVARRLRELVAEENQETIAAATAATVVDAAASVIDAGGTDSAEKSEAGGADTPPAPIIPVAATAEQAEALRKLEYIPPVGKFSRSIKYIIPAAVGGLILSGFFFGGLERGREVLLYWIICNGILAALGSIIALAHPLTIIGSALAAPITSLNPTIGAGVVAAIIEGTVRKPRAIDVERLPKDITSLGSMYRNRITKLLLVFFLCSIGSAIGTFVALPLLIP